MASNTLTTRIALKTDTTENWSTSTLVLLKGELAIDIDMLVMKVGDGINTYPDLPYATMTPEEIKELISETGHTHGNLTILDATTASFTQALLDKLNGIEEGATKVIVDDELSTSSTNPVQNQLITTELNNKVPTTRTINGYALTSNINLDADDVGAIPASEKGVAGGVATLSESGTIPESELPSYVDDIREGYLSNGSFYSDEALTEVMVAESGVIYVDVEANTTYRWTGTAYVAVPNTVALGTTHSTAYYGDLGQIAYEHSQEAHAPSDAEKNVIVGVQRNGVDLAIDSDRKVNVVVPTAVSELTNDAGYITAEDTSDVAVQLETARAIDGVNFDGTASIHHYGECDTAAATAAKTVALSNFTLVTGSRVEVKFTVTNTASNPTLNVNGTGAKSIYYQGKAITASYLAADYVYEFVYDGTVWNLVGDINTDNNDAVTQTITTTDAEYRVLLSNTADDTTRTEGARKASGLTYNPSTDTLTVGNINADITGDVVGNLIGNADTATSADTATKADSATQLETARTIAISGGATGTATAFDGTADIAIPVTSLNTDYLKNGSNTLVLDCGDATT